MELSINGQTREMRADTINELVAIELEGETPRGIAIALNGEVVPKARWSEAALKPGDRVEIVRALPGG